MQENRPYDQYYGTLRGGRGFADRTAPQLPNGNPIWYQPRWNLSDLNFTNEYILPFHTPFDTTKACCIGPGSMAYFVNMAIHNHGHRNGWNSAQRPGFMMAHFNRSDLPYYHALADTFTFSDNYFHSTFTATNPNRLHLFSGSNGLSVGSKHCAVNDVVPPAGFEWETMAETLNKHNITWKIFQEQDNFDDNAFAWFTTFMKSKPGDPLWDQGMFRSQNVVEEFAEFVKNDSLPSVSIIVGPQPLSEHAEAHPQDGEDLTARILQVLGDPANVKVFAKTAFILNYDENGGWFDHLFGPVPPKDEQDGLSTVTVEGELTKTFKDFVFPGNPIGLAYRVPLFLVSPWSRGGVVYSEINDHTSVLKFIEKRFNIHFPNISPWRRAIVGDLTAGFNFSNHDVSPWPSLPDTSKNVNKSREECETLPTPVIPHGPQTMPQQEPGVRPSRPLPYNVDVDGVFAITASGPVLSLKFNNSGAAGMGLQLFDRVQRQNNPRKYTVEAGKVLQDFITLNESHFGYSLHGPNGFVRQWGGPVANALGDSQLRYDTYNGSVVVLCSVIKAAVNFTVTDNAYGNPPVRLAVTSRSQVRVPVSASGGWYDVSVSSGDFVWRFMGRMETGRLASSDPAMAGRPPVALPAAGFAVGLEGFPQAFAPHPPVPADYRPARRDRAAACKQDPAKDTCGAPLSP